MTAQNKLESIAREHCAKLLSSNAAKLLPTAQAEALVIIAFTLGAAWGLDQPGMLAWANARIEALRNVRQ